MVSRGRCNTGLEYNSLMKFWRIFAPMLAVAALAAVAAAGQFGQFQGEIHPGDRWAKYEPEMQDPVPDPRLKGAPPVPEYARHPKG